MGEKGLTSKEGRAAIRGLSVRRRSCRICDNLF